MNDPSTPVLASVLCLRLADFPRRPVVEQAQLRARLEALAGTALGGVDSDRGLVLDSVDGLILVLLGDAGAALDAGEQILAGAADLPLALGLNRGPVTLLAADGPGDALAGDGIAAAVLAAGFAAPGQLRLSLPFREALAAQAPARAALLRPAGTFADAGLRSHELYEPGPLQAPQRRRRILGMALACALLPLAIVLGLRAPLWLAPPAIVALEIVPGGEVFVDGELRGSTPPLKTLELRAGSHRIEVRHGQHPPMQLELQLEAGQKAVVRHRFAPPGLLLFDLNDGVEVFVNGLSKGRAPALQRLELLAGRYQVELRLAGYAPLQLEVKLDPGERNVIRHRFGSSPKPMDKPAQLIRQWRRKLGFD
ncbi:MAG TPA: PEGA domain-containing protein [Solimonas sp.]|nr:PEGA domain-containing protein [Solimonas sp.]